MTVEELKDLCEQVIKNGYGDRDIYISDDEEGNGWHELLYGFSTDPEILEDISDDCVDIITLG